MRAARLAVLDPESLATIAQDVDPDDAADLLQDLPEDVIEEVLTALDDQERSRLESVLRYAEDTAGGLMNLDVVTIRPDVSLEVVSRFLRRRGENPREDQPAVRGRSREPLHRLAPACRSPHQRAGAHG